MSPAADDVVAALVALASIPGVGPATLLAVHRGEGAAAGWRRLREGRIGSQGPLAEAAERLQRADDAASRRGPRGAARMVTAAAPVEPPAVLDRHLAAGLAVLVEGAVGYPSRLAGDPAPPAALFVAGDPGLVERPTVAIVGTRNATRLGCDTAGALAVDLAACGVSVVSGLALGIDGAAHRALVEAPGNDGCDGRGPTGRPLAVVATGLDRSYPRRHRGLQAQVAACGAVVSEVPLGGGATAWRFPARNRIIAALADAVVIVESRSAGGSMLTAAEALARDRPILAVPGHPTAPASAGPLDLIADGAIPLRDLDDVLVAIGWRGQAPPARPATRRPGDQPQPPASAEAAHLRSLLDAGPATLGQLTARSSRSLGEVSAALEELQQRGEVQRSGLWFEPTGSTGTTTAGGAHRSGGGA